jgi:acetyltransferase
VRSDLKGRGLGDILLGKLIRYCRARGTGRLVGQVFAENSRMLGLAHDLGFRRGDCRDGIVDLVLELQAAGDRAN